MRLRRGNYTLLFGMSFTVLLGFSAFAVDIGRERLAFEEARVAAESAALASLHEIRVSSLPMATRRNQAKAQGELVGEMNTVKGTLGNAGNQGVQLDVDFGRWTWSGGNPGFVRSSASQSAVQVTATQSGMITLFGPMVDSLAGRSRGRGRSSDGMSQVSVTRTVVAAMKPRDTVIVLDTSRYTTLSTLNNSLDAIQDYLNTVRAMGVDGDRVGIVISAGDAQIVQPLSEVGTNYADIVSSVGTIKPCSIDDDAWFHFYRYENTRDGSPEMLDGESGWDYRPVETTDAFTGRFLVWPRSLVPDDYSMESVHFLETWTGGEINREDGSRWPDDLQTVNLTDAEYCRANVISKFLFENLDPRISLIDHGDTYTASPLKCYDGHYLDGDPRRVVDFLSLPGVYCDSPYAIAAFSGPDEQIAPDVPTVGGDDGIDYFADRSYSMAGANLGRGLSLARDMLAAAARPDSEPTVILMTPTKPKCGPYNDEAVSSECEFIFETEAWAAVDGLDDIGATVHVVARVNDGTEDDVFLSGLTVNGGVYETVSASMIFMGRAMEDLVNEVSIVVVEQ